MRKCETAAKDPVKVNYRRTDCSIHRSPDKDKIQILNLIVIKSRIQHLKTEM